MRGSYLRLGWDIMEERKRVLALPQLPNDQEVAGLACTDRTNLRQNLKPQVVLRRIRGSEQLQWRIAGGFFVPNPSGVHTSSSERELWPSRLDRVGLRR
eukprot:m.120650 g.120650  ORF g.120650 m.120650 type:complete len:99 (-) comp13350_c0_seq2:249-545(-)